MDYNAWWVLAGCMLIGAGAAVVGSFAYLRKKALAGDAIAHSILPGVVLAFMLSGYKSMWVLFPGALAAGWFSLWVMDAITRSTRIKPDAAIAIVLSVFFAFGLVLLSIVQTTGGGQQAGLDTFLFGKAAAMVSADIYVFAFVDIFLIILIGLFYPYLKLLSFDVGFARSTGLPVRFLEFLLSTLTVLSVATGIQAVGVVLMAALIITPAAAARFFVKRLSHMLVLAGVFGLISAALGALISYTTPKMPTGPWIVIVLSVLAMLSFVFAPQKGMFFKYRMRIKHQRKVQEENILKELYRELIQNGSPQVAAVNLLERRKFDGRMLETGLQRLVDKDLVHRLPKGLTFTVAGEVEASRVVRLHRLWELYLTARMNIAEDHVHHDAEAIEHIITPELEAMLIAELGNPQFDPHQSIIPGVPLP